MKLLIDIPEHIYEHAKESSEDSRDEFDAMRAIANGTQQESRSENPNTCGDAISRQSAIFLASDLKQDLPDDERIADMVMAHNEGILEYQTQLSLLPSVTPQQKMGRWIKQNYGWNWQCSECRFVTPPSAKEIFTFCPKCGAKQEVDS